MAMAQMAYWARPAFSCAPAPTSKHIDRAQMPIFQAYLRPSSEKTTDRHCIKVTTTIDPTYGSAGMLIYCIAYLKEHGREWRNVSIYGQEIVTLTSAIGRMNLLLHGVQDFEIVNGDTLASPAFTENGKLKTFDLILANPPYSISQWNREAFASDKYGRNILGVPPQGRADYAFFQHILKSLDEETGRCAILFPHGCCFGMKNGI